MKISLGVRRSLQQCSQPDGTFAMLAMDQRGSLVKAINPDAPERVGYKEVIALKRDVIGALSPLASAVLLDVEYGYGPCVASDALSGQTGLMENYPIEKQSIGTRERIVLPLVLIQHYAILKLNENPAGEDAETYKKLIIRTVYGIVNAGRNVA